MPSMPRMRTIQQCSDYIKTIDPDTSIKENFIRTLVIEGVLPSVKAGCKYLVNLDVLIDYLNNGGEQAEEPDVILMETVQNKIRKVPV